MANVKCDIFQLTKNILWREGANSTAWRKHLHVIYIYVQREKYGKVIATNPNTNTKEPNKNDTRIGNLRIFWYISISAKAESFSSLFQFMILRIKCHCCSSSMDICIFRIITKWQGYSHYWNVAAHEWKMRDEMRLRQRSAPQKWNKMKWISILVFRIYILLDSTHWHNEWYHFLGNHSIFTYNPFLLPISRLCCLWPHSLLYFILFLLDCVCFFFLLFWNCLDCTRFMKQFRELHIITPRRVWNWNKHEMRKTKDRTSRIEGKFDDMKFNTQNQNKWNIFGINL